MDGIMSSHPIVILIITIMSSHLRMANMIHMMLRFIGTIIKIKDNHLVGHKRALIEPSRFRSQV